MRVCICVCVFMYIYNIYACVCMRMCAYVHIYIPEALFAQRYLSMSEWNECKATYKSHP